MKVPVPDGTYHVHPAGTNNGQVFAQPPSPGDRAAAQPAGSIHIVVGARDQTVYFYDASGQKATLPLPVFTTIP